MAPKRHSDNAITAVPLATAMEPRILLSA
ncbi:MAG: LEPR-XLL domain-containing protein, partial [Gammaproteobacteria bacterium]